jgi:hypothetical protein
MKVLVYWSIGVMEKEKAFLSLYPILQYSNTPFHFSITPDSEIP